MRGQLPDGFEKYFVAMCAVTAALGLKLVVMTLLTVRARIVAGQLRPIPEDDSPALKWLIGYVFKPLLLICPIGMDDDAVESDEEADSHGVVQSKVESDPCVVAWMGAHRNATEQEPWFLFMVLVYPFIIGQGCVSWAYIVVWAYLTFRVLHLVCYVGQCQPWRSLFFFFSVVAHVIMSVLLLEAHQGIPTCTLKSAVCLLVGVLGLKNAVTTLLTIRSRIVQASYRPIAEDDKKSVAFLINYIFKPLLFICPIGPDRQGSRAVGAERQGGCLEEWLGSHRNATEQEPWFLAMAITYWFVGVGSLAGVGNDDDALLSNIQNLPNTLIDVGFGDLIAWNHEAYVVIYVYLGGRVLHQFCYLCGLQPWRTLAFTGTIICQVVLALMMLHIASTLEKPYFQACLITVASLGLKTVIITFLTLRCRIVAAQFRPIAADHNASLQFLIDYVFKPLLFVCPIGPSEPEEPLSEEDEPIPGVDTDSRLLHWLGTHRNSLEQEPWTMAMVLGFLIVTWDLTAVAMPWYAKWIVYKYLAMRVLHNLAYVCGCQPWRSLFFLGGVVCSLAFSVLLGVYTML